METKQGTLCRPHYPMFVRKLFILFLIIPFLASGLWIKDAFGVPPGLIQIQSEEPPFQSPHQGVFSEPVEESKPQGSPSPRTIGATVYNHMCAFCHGKDGNGGGKAMDYLYPWPRDFRKGIFKFRTTPSGSLPLDADIYRTIVKGVPGTAMPGWGQSLTKEETWAVVNYIKAFSKRFEEEVPKEPLVPGPVPPTNAESIKRGKTLSVELRCGRCHGSDLKGDGPLAEQLFDIWDHRQFVYDLTDPNTYKWGYSKKEIYMTLTTGLEGTPMKSYGHLSEEERWAVAAYVESKIQLEQYQSAEYESDLRVTTVDDEIDLDPHNPIWNNVKDWGVHLIPLSARRNPINRIKIQALKNEEGIAFRLEWDDAVANRSSSRHQDYKDAVAIEFALGDATLHTHGHNEPFFGMGNRGKVVNIWQWRADWQQEIETKRELEYATKGLDMDVMIFGGEVNPVDALNPFREVPVEELNAEGFGTLTPQPRTKQNVEGKGIWEDGKWKVVLFRTLDSLNKWDVNFLKKRPLLVAFAVWNGETEDRNGRKVVSMWQRLHLP